MSPGPQAAAGRPAHVRCRDGTALVAILQERLKIAVRTIALLLAFLPQAHAQVMQTRIPNSPWSVSAIAGSNPACSMDGLVGQGTLSLTVLGDVPGFVHLQLDKRASSTPGGPARAVFHFAGYPDVSLSALTGGASMLFNLTAAELPAWMHGFTAAQDAIIEFPGTGEPPWVFDLRGTTPAVDAMQRCISDQGIAGVPAPFASVPVPPVVKPGSRCLAYDPAVTTITGTIGMATGYGPPGFGEDPKTDPEFSYAELTPDHPVCVTGGKANDFDDADGVRTMELFLADRSKAFDARPWLGRHVAVRGVLDRTQFASEAATQLYLVVALLRTTP